MIADRFCSHAARRYAGGVLFIASLLTGCATAPQSAQLSAHPPRNIAPQVELSDVPFFPQERHQCGPAALATALDASGAQITPDTLVPEIYLPAREGSLQLELIAATRRQGYVPYVIAPQLHDLFAEIAAGHPVVVLQNLALPWYPRWHYAVAVGYDLEAHTIVLRSGKEKRDVTELSRFEYTWARSEHWAMVVLPPERLPATAEESHYLKAVAAFEEIGQPAIAHTGYQSALVRWPQSTLAWMGLGNSAYALGERDKSEQAFRRLLTIEPDYAPALNNLAQLLAERERWEEAESLAQRAVEIDGGRTPLYMQSLAEIRNRLH